ncbi:MAG TPA: Rid family hydrolase [Pseudolysinimonas sp.]|nr:Rid family hydrolase [Pseudolysinimonas sp.]
MPDYQVVPGPVHIHPFASVVASDDLIFVTGVAFPAATVTEQTRGTYLEIQRLLEEVGSSLSEIVFIRQTVTDRAYIDDVIAVSREFLPDPKPAAGTLMITPLVHPDLMVEMEVIAQRGARLLPPV